MKLMAIIDVPETKVIKKDDGRAVIKVDWDRKNIKILSIKTMPNRKKVEYNDELYEDWMVFDSNSDYDKGFNDCLDEIFGEEE